MNNANPRLLSFFFIAFLFGVFLGLSFFVSSPARAAHIDRYILYHIDEIFGYCVIRGSVTEPLAFFVPYCRFLALLVARLFYELLPLGITSLRIMSSVFSAGILIILWRLTEKIGFRMHQSLLVVLFTVTCALYFICSVAVLTEAMFGFILISGLYALYSNRYLIASALASLLPLVRQEGFIYLGVFVIALVLKKKYRYLALAVLPSAIWALLSWKLMGYSLPEWFLVIQNEPPKESLMPLSSAGSFLFLAYQPLTVFALIGIAISSFDKKLFPVLLIILIQIMFFGAVLAVVFFMSRQTAILYDIRFLVSIIPLLSIIAVVPLRRIEGLNKASNSVPVAAISVACLILPASLFYSIHKLQRVAIEREGSFTFGQEAVIQEAGGWLTGYLSENQLFETYVPGGWATDKGVRRIWMYLPRKVAFYSIVEMSSPQKSGTVKNRLLNMVSNRFSESDLKQGVFISIFRTNEQGFPDELRNINCRLVKEYPTIPLYFYRIE